MMDEKITVYKAMPGDLEKLEKLFKLSENDKESQIRKQNLKIGAEACFVAKYENNTAGVIIAMFKNDNIPMLVSPNRRAYLYGLSVIEEFRSKGIAKALVTAAASYCCSIGYLEQSTLTSEDNTAAINVYRQAGFKCVSENIKAVNNGKEYICDFYLKNQ